jgi:hypothetical protein
MKAEQFLKFFEDRRFTVLLKNGSLAVEPFRKLNRDDHKTIAKVAADPGARTTLARLLREREEALVRGLSPDQAHAVDRTRAALDATFLKIQQAEIRPGVQVTLSPKNPQQSRLFASNIRQKPVDVSESATPAGAQICPHCACRCDDPQTVRCPNCNTLLDSIEPSTLPGDEEPPAENKPSRSYPSHEMDRSPDREAEEDAKLDPSPNHDDAEIPAGTQPEIDPSDESDRGGFICTICRHRTSDPGDFHCAECKGLLIPAAAVATPHAARVAAPEAEPNRTEQPPREDEPIAPIDDDDSEQEPGAPIARVSANNRTSQTSLKAREAHLGAPVKAEDSDDDAQNEIATVVPVIRRSRVQSPADEVYEPEEEPAPAVEERDRSKQVLLWVTVERVRQGGRPALLLKLSSSRFTNSDAVQFTVEEGKRLLTGPRTLTSNGLRLVRQGGGRLRLGIKVRR